MRIPLTFLLYLRGVMNHHHELGMAAYDIIYEWDERH